VIGLPRWIGFSEDDGAPRRRRKISDGKAALANALRNRSGGRSSLDASPNENRFVIFLSPLSKSAVQISLKKCEKSIDILLRT
jgi:hypothetical protein